VPETCCVNEREGGGGAAPRLDLVPVGRLDETYFVL